MSNRTFCVLLMSVLMLFGAAAALLRERSDSAEETFVQDTSAQIDQELKTEEELLLPAFSEISEIFGAAYSEEYGQWHLQEKMTVRTRQGSSLYAPVSGVVEKIEGMTEGEKLFSAGSRISLRCGQAVLTLYPVYGVRVFEGSRVTQRDMLGSTDELLTLYAEKNGVPIDPLSVCIENQEG